MVHQAVLHYWWTICRCFVDVVVWKNLSDSLLVLAYSDSFVDYVVTDRIITPPEVKSHFVEKFLYVPYSYQVNSQVMEDKIVGSAAKGARSTFIGQKVKFPLRRWCTTSFFVWLVSDGCRRGWQVAL